MFRDLTVGGATLAQLLERGVLWGADDTDYCASAALAGERGGGESGAAPAVKPEDAAVAALAGGAAGQPQRGRSRATNPQSSPTGGADAELVLAGLTARLTRCCVELAEVGGWRVSVAIAWESV